MKLFSRFNRIDFGLLFTLVMCAFAVLPLLAHPGLFVGHDTLNHVYRVAEVDRIWNQGILLPRWAETFYSGYGSPVFQYYASLTYYICALLMRLFGLDALGSLRLMVILCLPGAGAGMYLFMRGEVGKMGGILAALVYVYSPYLLFTEPVTRGDYPELLCYALFPLVMWRFQRLLHSGRGRDFAWAAVSVAPFSLSHNLMSLVLCALMLGWLIWQKFVRLIDWKQLNRALLAAVVGIGLTAFFWLPVFLERGEVHLDNVPENIQSEQRNFFGFFVPLDRLLAPSSLTDAGAANGILLRLNLGVAQWGLAAAGVAGIGLLWWRARKKIEPQSRREASHRTQSEVTSEFSLIPHTSYLGTFFLSTQHSTLSTLFFAAAALGMILFILPLSYGLWAGVHALNFMEFPWRLLGPVVFCLAVLAGMNGVWIARLQKRWREAAAIALIILPILLAVPTLYVPPERALNLDTTQAGYLEAELSGQVSPGTSARNDFLPRAALVIPGATQSLLDDYADGYPVNKINQELLPAGTTVRVIEHTPHLDTWGVNAPEAFTLETFTFYFAGWGAEVDGQPVPITASHPHGFITIPIPAGEHTVRLFLGQTPARYTGMGVSLLAVIGLIAFTVIISKTRVNPQSVEIESRVDKVSRLTALIYLVSSILSVVMVLLLMREGTAWIESPPGEARAAQHPTQYAFGTDIGLLGYDLSSETARPGDWLEVVLYWYAHDPTQYNYASFLHFSEGERPLAQADKPILGGQLTSEWLPGAYRLDSYTIHIPPDVPLGEYRLNLGLYTCETRPAGECGNGERLPVFDAAGNALGDILHLTTVTVR